MSTKTKDVAREANGAVFTEAELMEITDFESLVKFAAKNHAPDESISDYGDGFSMVEDKETLIKTPFIIVDWNFRDGDHGEYVSARIMTQGGDKLVINDGSTGICEQLRQVTAKRLSGDGKNAQQWLTCERGLRASRYDKEINGKVQHCVTYYLA